MLANAILLIFFLFKIPNFYILPFFRNSFLTTQALARIIILLIFLVEITKNFVYKRPFFNQKKVPTTLIFLICIFFGLQSLSIISANNITAFLNRYKDVFISFLFFIVTLSYRQHYKKIAVVFFLAAMINCFYQTIIFFFPDFFIKVLSNFIYQKHAEMVLMNINRGRILTDAYDEIVIPFLLFNGQLVNILLFISITIFSFLSNFRSRILMLAVSFIGVLITTKKFSLKQLFIATLSVLIISYGTNLILSQTVGYSLYDRFILSEEENTQPISWRSEQIKTSFQLGRYTLFGVGLGNYYDNLPAKEKRFFSFSNWVNIASRGATEYVHNIFGTVVAETGYLSLFVFVIILILFIKHDFFLIKKGDNYQKATIIAFWSLFSYGLLNPIIPASYQVLFWGLRGLIAYEI